MRVGAGSPGSGSSHGERISLLPRTQLGQWAVGLAGAFIALVLVSIVVPRGGRFAVVFGLLGGILALTAILRGRERALTVFAALAPVAFAVAFVVAELVGGNG